MKLEIATPDALNFDLAKLAAAVNLASQLEIDWSRDLETALAQGVLDEAPYNVALGPVTPRGTPNGLIMRRGAIAATWGDIDREDFTFSIAKSYLALLAGVAVKQGLLTDLDARVRDLTIDTDFDSDQNRDITWRHLLQQTSEWEGTLFGLSDRVDRNRDVSNAADNSRKGQHRDLQQPGTFWEYNDVRVNRLSLSLMQLFKCALPEVLATEIMAPLNASRDWRWHGYRNAQVEVEGETLISVPGGTHWGGGLCIDSLDHARIGELVRRDGLVDGVEILPPGWCQTMLTPCDIKPDYGCLWWLNTDRQHQPLLSECSVFAVGAGGNTIWVEPDLELVVVARWLDTAREGEVFAAIADSAS